MSEDVEKLTRKIAELEKRLDVIQCKKCYQFAMLTLVAKCEDDACPKDRVRAMRELAKIMKAD